MPISKSSTFKESGGVVGPCKACCWWLAEFIMMDAIFEASMHEDAVDRHRPDIQRLRKEISQILKASKCLGAWLVTLSLFYLGMTAVNWYFLDIAKFEALKKAHWKDMYVDDLYRYTKDIEGIKIVHGLMLLGVTAFIYNMTRKNKVMTRRQYCQLLFLTIVISLLYIFPVLYIAKITFEEAKEHGSRLFADWTFMVLTNSDTNIFGVGVSVLIHAQIIMIIFAF